ncbi:hypothetical protein QYM36_010228 [Artemia franciscana]|uniref:Uncharacterized protein n=1 Tax=Artemia franciscana TaxID=6661 RepID=A0AA88L3Q0_ARTSF|nr:hypothetical protein QYM36_010228 [Artemia franciscana]
MVILASLLPCKTMNLNRQVAGMKSRTDAEGSSFSNLIENEIVGYAPVFPTVFDRNDFTYKPVPPIRRFCKKGINSQELKNDSLVEQRVQYFDGRNHESNRRTVSSFPSPTQNIQEYTVPSPAPFARKPIASNNSKPWSSPKLRPSVSFQIDREARRDCQLKKEAVTLRAPRSLSMPSKKGANRLSQNLDRPVSKPTIRARPFSISDFYELSIYPRELNESTSKSNSRPLKELDFEDQWNEQQKRSLDNLLNLSTSNTQDKLDFSKSFREDKQKGSLNNTPKTCLIPKQSLRTPHAALPSVKFQNETASNLQDNRDSLLSQIVETQERISKVEFHPYPCEVFGV